MLTSSYSQQQLEDILKNVPVGTKVEWSQFPDEARKTWMRGEVRILGIEGPSSQRDQKIFVKNETIQTKNFAGGGWNLLEKGHVYEFEFIDQVVPQAQKVTAMNFYDATAVLEESTTTNGVVSVKTTDVLPLGKVASNLSKEAFTAEFRVKAIVELTTQAKKFNPTDLKLYITQTPVAAVV